VDTSPDFVRSLVYCLAYDHWGQPPDWEVVHRLRHAGEPSTEGERLLMHMIEISRLVLREPTETVAVEEHTARLEHIQEQAEHLGNPQIALIMGGATKIKQYVFESAKLPEIRGASGLLDRVNLYDTPALFVKRPTWLRELEAVSTDEREKAEAEQLVKQVREWFQERYQVEPPDCEDCLVYASGGESTGVCSP
jgi:CRISPR-associated protein Cmr2